MTVENVIGVEDEKRGRRREWKGEKEKWVKEGKGGWRGRGVKGGRGRGGG